MCLEQYGRSTVAVEQRRDDPTIQEPATAVVLRPRHERRPHHAIDLVAPQTQPSLVRVPAPEARQRRVVRLLDAGLSAVQLRISGHALSMPQPVRLLHLAADLAPRPSVLPAFEAVCAPFDAPMCCQGSTPGAGTPVLGHSGGTLLLGQGGRRGCGDGTAGRSKDMPGMSGQSWASPVTVTR